MPDTARKMGVAVVVDFPRLPPTRDAPVTTATHPTDLNHFRVTTRAGTAALTDGTGPPPKVATTPVDVTHPAIAATTTGRRDLDRGRITDAPARRHAPLTGPDRTDTGPAPQTTVARGHRL